MALPSGWEMAAGCGSAPAPSGGSPTPGERRALILRHGEEMFLRHGAHGLREMRKHLAWYSRGVPGAGAFRAELPGVTDPDSFRAVVGRFF